ncbi:MAG: 4-alpha-glucanotransferase, partial [Clostridia bacterium]|nr:4-alpha-glucanotransferase [Clostridia bacterium]
WWRSRLKGAASRCDIIRIDHFRGLESFWGVAYGAADARVGQWYPGPGMKLIRAFREEGMGESIIAEDLGFLTPEVKKLLNDSGCPGMRVMQFGFEPMGDSRELPHNYVKNCVAYLGTHDNDTIMGWFNATAPSCAAFAVDYLGLNQQEGFPFGFIRGLMTSVADLVVIQMQDVLGLGSEHRMNLPATTGWWGWRALPEEFDPATADRLAYYTRMSGRAPAPKKR